MENEKQLSMSIPQLGLVAATRGLIGFGAGLMLANKISRDKRKAIGLPIFIAGVASTIPIALHIFHNNHVQHEQLGEKEGETEH